MLSPLALGALALALGVHVELLQRLRRAESASPWWFGYARDGVNLSAALMLWGGYLLAGWAAPVALLAALFTSLASYVLDWLVARALKVRHVRSALLVLFASWLVTLGLAHQRIASLLGRLIHANQPL